MFDVTHCLQLQTSQKVSFACVLSLSLTKMSGEHPGALSSFLRLSSHLTTFVHELNPDQRLLEKLSFRGPQLNQSIGFIELAIVLGQKRPATLGCLRGGLRPWTLIEVTWDLSYPLNVIKNNLLK